MYQLIITTMINVITPICKMIKRYEDYAPPRPSNKETKQTATQTSSCKLFYTNGKKSLQSRSSWQKPMDQYSPTQIQIVYESGNTITLRFFQVKETQPESQTKGHTWLQA